MHSLIIFLEPNTEFKAQSLNATRNADAAPGVTAQTRAISSPSGKFSALSSSQDFVYTNAWIVSLQRHKNNQSTH